MKQKRVEIAADIGRTLFGRPIPEKTQRKIAEVGGEDELELAKKIADEIRRAIGSMRDITPKRITSVAKDLIEVAREGEGIFWLSGNSIHILPKSWIPKTGAFDGIPAGAQVHGLRAGLRHRPGVGYSLEYAPDGRGWSADSVATHLVLRGLLERSGFAMSFSWDYGSARVRTAARNAMLAYLERGSEILLSLQTIPVDNKVLREGVSNMEAWPELQEEHALRGDPLNDSREHAGRLFFRDWSRLHSGSFKDRAALVEAALCLSVHKATGKPVVGLMATTGNMGASFAETIWYMTHEPTRKKPGYGLIYAVGSEPAVAVMLYGTKFNPKKKERMLDNEARLREGFETFNSAFNALKDAMWDSPVRGATPVWCGDTSIRIEASKVFAYEMLLDLVGKDPQKKAKVVEYLKSGGRNHEGRRVLNETARSLSAVVQVGNGINYAGIAKGFDEMVQLGVIDDVPELIPVQPKKAVDIKDVYEMAKKNRRTLNKAACIIPEGSVTTADGVDCPFPVAGHLVYHWGRRQSIKVSDDEIRGAREKLKRNEDIECELAGAAGYAALMQENMLRRLLARGRTVVAFITGSKKD